jgi:SAM-dependent methyltransferase
LHYDEFKSVIENKLLSHIPALISAWRTNSSSNKAQLSHDEIQHVSKALLSLQRGLTGDRQLAGAGYMDDSAMLGAYLLYYWPVSYMQMSYALCDCKEQIQKIINSKEESEIKILDLGCGPAPASIAVVDSLLRNNTSTKKLSIGITLVDSSEKAMALAKKIGNTEYSSVHVDAIKTNFEKDGVSLIDKIIKSDKYDVIVMCHALNELWKDGSEESVNRRSEFINEVSKYLDSDGFILICEPALLSTSRNLLAVRDLLIKKELSIVAPCPCNAESNVCPALVAGPNHTCHAEIDWQPKEPVQSLAKAAGLDRESVKMTYIVLQHKKINDIGASKSDHIEKVSGRIVSEGMLNKAGRIRYLICNGKNRIAVSAKNQDAHAKQIGFFSLKRLDLIEIENPEIRGDKQTVAYGIGPATKLQIKD